MTFAAQGHSISLGYKTHTWKMSGTYRIQVQALMGKGEVHSFMSPVRGNCASFTPKMPGLVPEGRSDSDARGLPCSLLSQGLADKKKPSKTRIVIQV